jgi:hypothetical protein
MSLPRFTGVPRQTALPNDVAVIVRNPSPEDSIRAISALRDLAVAGSWEQQRFAIRTFDGIIDQHLHSERLDSSVFEAAVRAVQEIRPPLIRKRV